MLAALLAGCMSSPTRQASQPSPTPTPPPGVSSETGVAIEGDALVHDIRYASGAGAVVGYLVLGDVVAVTGDGCEVLTQTPRELFSVAA